MNITPRIKSARNRNNLIVNVSIEIPLKSKIPVSHRSQEVSLSPSPNKLRKRYKLTNNTNAQKKSLNASNINTLREAPSSQFQQAPSRKKYSNPTPSTTANLSSKGTFAKFKSCDLSPPKKRLLKEKGKGKTKIRNISILEQVINEDDNIIKYTSNSNELKDKAEDLLLIENLGRKIDTNVSEIDIAEVRRIENSARDSRQKLCVGRINDILRTACAKKIQRAWRNYKTKKLIRCYSNDIRNKYLRNMHISDEPILTARSQPIGLNFKKKLMGYDEIVAGESKDSQQNPNMAKEQEVSERSDRSSKIVKKIQEDNLEKWEGFLEQIKNKKNLTAALQFSIERRQELKRELESDFFKKEGEADPSEKKIIKTKKYYEGEREKWRENIERSNGSIKREERVNYFENEMLRLENDYSDSADSSITNSLDIQSTKQQEEMENLKLRKKLEVFRNHLPEVHPFQAQDKQRGDSKHQNNRIDIATIIRKKSAAQQPPNPLPLEEIKEEVLQTPLPKSKSIEIIEFDISEQAIEKSPESSSSSQSLIDTHREWRPLLQLQECQEEGSEWRARLKQAVEHKQSQMNQLVLEQLILEALIEVSESQKLIAFIKSIYEKSKSTPKKAEGIVTNHSSIKDYINYFINYLIQYKIDGQIYKNLQRPLGPTPRDVLKYFRGEEIAYDPDTEYVMGISVFNSHWEYANDLIYFDKKWDDEAKENQRVSYLKQLTKVFFRAIFDCFNQSLESQRIYGLRGKPYPWSQQKLKVEAPELKRALSLAFQRVLRCSLVFAGVLFKDKQHSLDAGTMDEIQQANMVKLITFELRDDEPLWLFLEDELAEIKLELTQHVQQVLLKEVANIIGIRGNISFR